MKQIYCQIVSIWLLIDLPETIPYIMITRYCGLNIMYKLLSKPNATQLNSTQSNFKATSVGVRHSSHVFHPTTIFPATSRAARVLTFGTDTHYTNRIKIT